MKQYGGMSARVGSKRQWYEEWFGEEYLKVYNHRNQEDARRLIKLIFSYVPLNNLEWMLDVGCGHGRHARLLANENKKVIGIDLSHLLIEKARKDCQHLTNIRFFRANKSALPLKSVFQAVFSLFTSFGYFDTDVENQNVLEQYAFVLRKKGWLVIDYLNPGYVRKNLERESKRHHNAMLIQEKRWIAGGRINKKIILKSQNRQKTFLESVRLYELSDMLQMLDQSGFETIVSLGDYYGHSFTADSPRMILINRKK
ncbi:MAG: methyltransferase domain-containing protein [Caldithrix sp.]|nr:methyltransferase domain-containing protein [Caldithrix sp.]